MRAKICMLRGNNFKALNNLVNIDGSITINGKNGTGKTTCLDLICWVLFNKGIDMKAISPEPVNNPDAVVEGILHIMIDGSEYTLNRKQTDGKSSYLINGIPKKKKEWDAFLTENICDVDKMMALMLPNYFCSKQTEIRKSILFNMAKSHSDAEIIKKLGFDIDVSEIGLADYKAKAKSRMKDIESICGKSCIYIHRQIETAKLIKYELECAKAGKKAIEIIDKCISNLTNNLNNYTQEYADNERILYQITQIEEEKEKLMIDEINSHFGMVEFKMSEIAKNGNIISCCIPVYDGYELGESANTARELKAKVDICRGLQDFYGIHVPILLDNAESLDKKSTERLKGMLNGVTQVIMAKVSDSKLTIKEV